MRMGMGIGMGMRMRMRMRLHLNNSSAATTVCFYFILHIEFQCEMFFSLLFFCFSSHFAGWHECAAGRVCYVFHTFPYFPNCGVVQTTRSSTESLCIYVFRVLRAPSSIWPKTRLLGSPRSTRFLNPPSGFDPQTLAHLQSPDCISILNSAAGRSTLCGAHNDMCIIKTMIIHLFFTAC